MSETATAPPPAKTPLPATRPELEEIIRKRFDVSLSYGDRGYTASLTCKVLRKIRAYFEGATDIEALEHAAAYAQAAPKVAAPKSRK